MFGEARPRVGFVCGPLRRGEERMVYPLLRHAGLAIDLSSWLRHAKRLVEPTPASRRGALTVRRTGAPMPCGLFCYARDQDLVHGNVLTAQHFVALDIVNPDDALAALLDGLDYLSATLGIRTVRAVVAPGETALASVMEDAGLCADARILSKSVTRLAFSGTGENTNLPGRG